ncbi:Integrator complex subunit 3, partial [Lunasporangiospora selenospora]
MAVPEPPPPSLIFDFAQFDEEDAVDTEMSQAHGQLLESLKGKSEIEIHNYLQESASVSMKKHAEIINGLLYGILTNRDTAREQFQHLNFVARDSLAFALRQTRYFCSLHQFHKIRPQVREQLVWLVNELTVVRVHGVEALYLNLLRQIRGGDISQPNIQLAEAMLKLLQTHLQPWVYMFPHLVAFSCFTYLRLMLDHSRFVPLRQAEATFCAKLLRERFRDCSDIGRDLVRALQDVARIKEIEEIWQDLLYSPSKLNPQLEGIHQLMAMPTREVYLQSRLTYDMEHKLLHILKHIHFGQHHRNMQWFMDRYLTAPEADALHCDLIRYICCVYHPTNAVLASTIVPRWVLIGGVLRAIKSNVTAANVKLALFYDWLFYDPAKDNIMNIEPAMLLMERSLERYPYITSILFEFLHFVTENYYPPLRDRIHLHVQQAGQALVEKGVIRSLHLIYQAPVFADYPPIRKYMAIMFPNILGDVAESTTGTSIENSLADSSSENNSPQPDSETFDSSNESGVMDEYEYASSSHPSFSTLQDTDDEEQGERQEQKSRDSSRESSREPMHVDEPTRSSTVKANDEEEEEEDEVMESSVAEPAPQQQQSRDLGADALGDWTFAGESDVIGSASKDDLGTTAATPVPGASLWIFGSSLQEFKKAYETNPESSETSNMFKHIWEVYGDVAGAGVVGSDIAHEIGHEICAFAQKTELAENYFSDPADQADKTSTASGSDDSTGTIDALTTCLWRVTKRDGEEGAQRVAEMMIKSEAHMARSERMLGMWYLLGLLRGQLLEVASPFTTLASLSRVSGTADTPSLQDAVQLYGMYLETSASQDISTTMDETDATSQELVQECLERDLQRIQDRQLEIFDTVLPLVLQYLPEFIPRTAQFLKMVLAMAIPSQVYRLSSGLMRGDFVLFSPLSPKMSTKDRTEQSDSSATQTSKMSKNMKSGTKQENTGSLFMGAGARDTADGRHLITSQTLDVLGQTLEWGVFEQLAVWQLVLSEYGGNTDAIAELLRATWVPGMTISTHPESLGGLLNLSRTVSSSSPPNLKLGVSLVRIAAASKDSQVTDSLSWTSFAPTPTSQDMMEFCQTWMLTWTRDFPEPVVEVLLYLSDKTSTPVETTLGISGGSSGSTVSNGDTEQENNTSTKNLRNSRSRSGHVRTKLTPRQRKEQGNYLRVTLKLLQFCWESLERYPQESLSVRDRRRQAFLDIWSAR